MKTLLLISLLVPVKPARLTNFEKQQFSLSGDLKDITIGLILGDLYVRKSKGCVNPMLVFEQSLVHKDYVFHLHELFADFCISSPKIKTRKEDNRTGKVYSSVWFNTRALPCFNQLYDLFYLEGKKVVPSNISELLTESSLAYWLCDDGTFSKEKSAVILCTESFSEFEVDLLLAVLSNKFGLKCRKDKRGNGFRIVIVKSSLTKFRELVHSHLPSSMLYKIGL